MCFSLLSYCDNQIMADSILSQAEIDALLNGDSDSDSAQEVNTTAAKPDDGVKPFDPTTQRRVVRERLQALEIINERFARHFRMGLFNLLRRSPDITVRSEEHTSELQS